MAEHHKSAIDVLVIDDSVSDGVLIDRWLRESPIVRSVTLIHDGQEALDFLQERSTAGVALPDVILLDLNLPRVSGIEVLEAIGREPRFGGILVLVLTSPVFPEDEQRVRSLGAAGCFEKPSDMEEFQMLASHVERLWRERRSGD